MFTKLLVWLKAIFHREERIEKVYGLNEYLDLISQYTDKTILAEEQNKNRFAGGECKTNVVSDEYVKFIISMYFVNDKDEWSEKTVKRVLQLKNFNEETQTFLREGEKPFEITKPTRSN